MLRHDIHMCGILSTPNKKGGPGDAGKERKVDGFSIVSDSELPHTQLSTLAVWTLILQHKTTELLPEDGAAKAFPHLSIFFLKQFAKCFL